ncbi:hypothetical protein CTAYLR_007561 [Chrysophaeum taylorii]|uniref:Fe2OG dioxygenase domain-containing protein n=1 Tax=Chrysophaeum taylorii TaxID=2483200 RepID=A0AAD7U4S8_9STRA|nr:hypothetical protein CTAYLR_007561 [Chrysophaeum taylorii]
MAAARVQQHTAWIHERIKEAIGLDDVLVASNLAEQPSEALLREAATLLGESPEALACVNEICARVWGSSKRRAKNNKKQQPPRKSNPMAPLNCLRCGFVNRAPARAIASEEYARLEARLRATRGEWGTCAACGDALAEQLRHGDAEDASLDAAVERAARLVRYDRESASRTRVIDDQKDWYASPPYEEKRTWKPPAVTIDFAGRKVFFEAPPEPTGVAATPPDWDSRPERGTPPDGGNPREFSIVRAPADPAVDLVWGDPPALDLVAPIKLNSAAAGACELRPGMVLLRGLLSLAQQRAVVDIVEAAASWDVPTYADGARLHCRMSCFGFRWDPDANRYVEPRDPVPAPLVDLATWASRAAATVDPAVLGKSKRFHPELLLANWYAPQGRMGMHRDDAEPRETLDAGSPVVSISIGAPADFAYADDRPTDLPGAPPTPKVTLQSGDILLFGGPSRLVFHGINRVFDAHRLPRDLNLKPGRLNLTFRALRVT